ncbi:MAG: hypothetical protein H6581_00070 [Bacteroidia bacterium]|nr:hypothetical protein [Bacteroidia bacterium]
MEQSSVLNFQIREHGLLPWSEGNPEKVISYEIPSEGGYFDLEGPRAFPRRPELRLFPGPGGLAGLIRYADQSTAFKVVLPGQTPSVIGLPSPPRSVCLRPDGHLWVLGEAGLSLARLPGLQFQDFGLPGDALVPCPDGSAWLLQYATGKALRVDADGQTHQSLDWPYLTPAVSGADGTLATPFNRLPPGLRLASPEGNLQLREVPGMDFFEKLLHFDSESTLTLAGATLRKYHHNQMKEWMVVQGAGLDHQGNPFVSGRQINQVKCWIHGLKNPLTFPLPHDTDWIRPYYVFRITRDGFVVKGDAKLLYYDAEGIYERSEDLNEDNFGELVFPWLEEVNDVVATPEGKVLVSLSGPEGFRVFEVGGFRS